MGADGAKLYTLLRRLYLAFIPIEAIPDKPCHYLLVAAGP